MKEAQEKAAAQRTDFSVGVEGNSNKQFQAQKRIDFGLAAAELRNRGRNENIGPQETKAAYL